MTAQESKFRHEMEPALQYPFPAIAVTQTKHLAQLLCKVTFSFLVTHISRWGIV